MVSCLDLDLTGVCQYLLIAMLNNILELWQQYPVYVVIAVAIVIIILSLIVVVVVQNASSRHGSDPDPTATLNTDHADNQASMNWNYPPEARPGNIRTVPEDHDQNTHITLTPCILESRNGAAFRYPLTKQKEAREPIKAENDFSSFIRDYVIPTFCLQRRDKQFAVLFLSKYDEYNIHKTQFGGSILNYLIAV